MYLCVLKHFKLSYHQWKLNYCYSPVNIDTKSQIQNTPVAFSQNRIDKMQIKIKNGFVKIFSFFSFCCFDSVCLFSFNIIIYFSFVRSRPTKFLFRSYSLHSAFQLVEGLFHCSKRLSLIFFFWFLHSVIKHYMYTFLEEK